MDRTAAADDCTGMTLRLAVAAATAVSSFALTAPAEACVTVKPAASVCHDYVPFVYTCVYVFGPPCTPFLVEAPLCVYGMITGHAFETTWCY